MAVKIYTDSTCDKTHAWYQENQVTMLPLTYLIGEEEFVDCAEEDILLAYYEKINAGATPKTSAVNTKAFIDSWTPHLENGDDIVFVGLGGKLSATVPNAQTAAEKLKGKYPDCQIYVVDSNSIAGGITNIIKQACDWRDAGESAQAIAEKAAEIAKRNEAWISVDDLQHLKRGGRLSSSSAMIGSILNIKPLLKLSNDGVLGVEGKAKGNKKAIKQIIENMKDRAQNPQEDPIYISYGLSEDLAKDMQKAIEDEFGNKDITLQRIGGVVVSHTGPYMFGVFYQSK